MYSFVERVNIFLFIVCLRFFSCFVSNLRFQFLFRNNVTYTIVYDDPKEGLMLHHSNRGRPQKLQCATDARRRITQLRRDLKFGSKGLMLLLLSYSTDSMIREHMKYPEVNFHDVTGRANKQKRDLFVTVGRKPSGKCFIINVTMIPSGQAWVYRIVIRDIFPIHFGTPTIRRNRLKLTDEDTAEYETIENLIFTELNYADDSVMLCVFHAVWGPFRDRIRKHLPKCPDGTLNKKGKAYGKYAQLLFITLTFFIVHLWNVRKLMLAWLILYRNRSH